MRKKDGSQAPPASDAPEARSSFGGLDVQVWKVGAVTFLGPFMAQLDSTVVNVSLSAIKESLHSTITSAQWIVSGYLLALALMLPLNGWMVDRVGAKRLYLICFSAFSLASLLCGSAGTMGGLICARVVQGMAGGLLAPMAQMMMARVAGKQMARAMGYSGVPIMFAPILGPVVAGAILKYAAWPWLFYLNLPTGILSVMSAAFFLPADEGAAHKRPFDFAGFALICPGLVLLLYGLEHGSSLYGTLIISAGLALIGLFMAYAIHRGSAALVDLRLFTNSIFARAAVTQFIANGQTFAGQFLIPFFLITGCRLSSTRTGWVLAPMGLGMMLSFTLIGFLTDRFGYRAVSTGGASVALLGTAPFLWMTHSGFSPALTAISLFVRGAGQGAINIPSMSAAYASVQKERLPMATTALNIVQRLGGPVATTVTAIVVSLSAARLPLAGPRTFVPAFVVLSGLHLAGVGAAGRLPDRVHKTES